MIDGSRRIAARAVRGEKSFDADLVIKKEHLASWLDQAIIKKTGELIQDVDWFKNYQNIPEIGLSGERTLKRYGLLDLSRIKGKTVADFGCNTGQSCFEFYYRGASAVWGFDVQQKVVDIANAVSNAMGTGERVKFFCVDFNDVSCFEEMDAVLPDKVDFSSFFSVYRTKELTQREKLFSYIISKTRENIFFEGHADRNIDTLEYYEELFKNNNLKSEFKGYGEEKIRPLFVLSLKRI
jgi:SAM-dependent methyltransferase